MCFFVWWGFFNRNLEHVNLPRGLKHLTFGWLFNQSLEGSLLPSSISVAHGNPRESLRPSKTNIDNWENHHWKMYLHLKMVTVHWNVSVLEWMYHAGTKGWGWKYVDCWSRDVELCGGSYFVMANLSNPFEYHSDVGWYETTPYCTGWRVYLLRVFTGTNLHRTDLWFEEM